MAVDACNCTDGTKDWGLSSCFNKFGYPLGYAFQKLKDSTGADNGLTGTEAAPLTQTAWEDSYLYVVDQSIRVNVLSNVKAVTDEREDPNTEDIDGVEFFVSEGTRKILHRQYPLVFVQHSQKYSFQNRYQRLKKLKRSLVLWCCKSHNKKYHQLPKVLPVLCCC